jgi:hypothetical protein
MRAPASRSAAVDVANGILKQFSTPYAAPARTATFGALSRYATKFSLEPSGRTAALAEQSFA